MDLAEIQEHLIAFDAGQPLNEADTRHQAIDLILHEVLSIPLKKVSCETHIHEGYADYVISGSDGSPLLVVEAKRSGKAFYIPKTMNDKRETFKPVNQLLTDETVKETLDQVVNYAIGLGCEFGAITNGRQWIFVRAFAKGQNWRQLKSFVVSSIDWFWKDYTRARNLLAYSALESNSLSDLLSPRKHKNREIFYSKDKIQNFDAPVETNRYAKYLRPLSSKFFQNLEDAEDFDFIRACYVQQREYKNASESIRGILRDSLTPYLEEFGVQQTDDNDKGGAFGNKLKKLLQDSKSAQVAVLFGGKGIGKSTFLRKLLFHEPPHFIEKHATIVQLDLLRVEDDQAEIRKYVWKKLVEGLDTKDLLREDRATLLHLFEDRFEIAKKQDLYGLPEDSIDYNKILNDLVATWKNDNEYTSLALASYWRRNHRGVVVIVDNTDQLSGESQDFCFTLAQQIANHLECLSLICMREERFHRSRVHGVLDAFQNSGYHLSSPLPKAVFQSRIRFVMSALENKEKLQVLLPQLYTNHRDTEKLIKFFKILNNEFGKEADSPLYLFLVACAHGNIRLALELFRDFIISGYTNVSEMVEVENLWTLATHQVVRPLMTPSRFFYQEAESAIPNVFQIRSTSKGSHFTSIRILKRLASGADPKNSHFVSVAELRDVFSRNYDLNEELESTLNILLQRGLVESNIRVDEYIPNIDQIRITEYGRYLLNDAIKDFTYLDLTSLDCGVFSESLAQDLAGFGNKDFRLFRSNKKLERVKTRIEKVRIFLSYLKDQEQWEVENLGVANEDCVVKEIHDAFEADVDRIVRSAERNFS